MDFSRIYALAKWVIAEYEESANSKSRAEEYKNEKAEEFNDWLDERLEKAKEVQDFNDWLDEGLAEAKEKNRKKLIDSYTFSPVTYKASTYDGL